MGKGVFMIQLFHNYYFSHTSHINQTSLRVAQPAAPTEHL